MTEAVANRLGNHYPLPKYVHTVGAEWSPCLRYRYALWRLWGDDPRATIACFIGMNPSSADEHHDDPTVRKCRGYAERWGYAGLLMLNAWAIRGTDPAEALQADQEPIGPDNDAWIADFAHRGHLPLEHGDRAPINLFVAAWGNPGTQQGRGAAVTQLVTRHRPLHALGTTQAGQPKHPSRLAYATALTLYHPRGTAR